MNRGNDILTTLIGGMVAMGIIFVLVVLLLSSCD